MKKIIYMFVLFFLSISVFGQVEIPKRKVHPKLPGDGTQQGKFSVMAYYNSVDGKYYYYDPTEQISVISETSILKSDSLLFDSDIDTDSSFVKLLGQSFKYMSLDVNLSENCSLSVYASNDTSLVSTSSTGWVNITTDFTSSEYITNTHALINLDVPRVFHAFLFKAWSSTNNQSVDLKSIQYN